MPPFSTKSPYPQAEAARKIQSATTSGKTPAATAHTGITSGKRIMEFQDQTMADQPKRKLTDEEIGEIWEKEFPQARCQFAKRMDIVRTVRRLFNAGRHGKQSIRSNEPVLKYEIKDGERVPVPEKFGRGRRPKEKS